MSRDELDAFDSIDHSDQTEPEHWAKIDEPERERPRRGRRALIVALLLILAGVLLWRIAPWDNKDAAPAPAAQSPATTAPAAGPSSGGATTAPATASGVIGGEAPQAVEGREAPTSGVVDVAKPSQPKVDAGDPESVMRGMLTALNNRATGDASDLTTAEQWTRDYVPLSLVDVDPYQAAGPMNGRAPAAVQNIELARVPDAKPADSRASQTRQATVRVQSNTGEVIVQTWLLTASLDGKTWKITDAALESWTGATAS